MKNISSERFISYALCFCLCFSGCASTPEFSLGEKLYYEGKYDMALPLLISEEKKSHSPEVQYILGVMYFEGEGANKDVDKAFYWWEKSAENGENKAQMALNTFYILGYEDVPKNCDKAVYWIQKAASQNPFAKFLYAMQLMDGLCTSKDQHLALELLHQADASGDKAAPLELGRLYMTGEVVPVDYVKARSYFLKAKIRHNEIADEVLKELDELEMLNGI